MADDKKNDRFKHSINGFVNGMKSDSKSRLKSLAWGAVNDAWDVLSNNFKKSVSSYIFPDGSGPKVGYGAGRRGNGDDYLDYASYSRSYREVQRDRDTVGNRSAKLLQAVWAPTEEKAQWIVGEVQRKIRTSSINACRVGDLYEMATPKIAPSTMDWKYGWIDKDLGQIGYDLYPSGPHAGEYLIKVPEPHLL